MNLWLPFLRDKMGTIPIWISAKPGAPSSFPHVGLVQLCCYLAAQSGPVWYCWTERIFSHSEKTMPREEMSARDTFQIKMWLKRGPLRWRRTQIWWSPPHKYIKNISICGTTPTEHLLNTGRRPQTSQKARKSPRTWPCGWQGLGALAGCQAWASEVGELSSGHWTSRDILAICNINHREFPKDLRLNTKKQLHSMTSKLQCWTPHVKQPARNTNTPISRETG